MMKNNGLIKYFFCCGAIIYTIGSALILVISLLLSEGDAASILAPKPFLFYLIFAYVISLGNTIYKIESISAPIRRLIHASAYILGLFAFLLLCAMNFTTSVIISAVFAILYALIIFIAAIIKGKVGRLSVTPNKDEISSAKESTQKQSKKKSREKEEYKSRFS